MKLTKLLSPWLTIPAEFDCDIAGISIDSRRILPNEMFIALRGTKTDGREYIDKALQIGATVILAEGEQASVKWHDEPRVPYITVPDLNATYGHIAARFYGDPSQHLQVIGVTGTNGKTSVTHYIATLLTRLGKPCGVLGTLGNGAIDNLQPTINTTPDAITIQRFLAEMLKQGFHSVAMEVSSHALDQQRVNGVHFAAGVFTNLSLDHLDYHHSFEAYAHAKQKLFTQFKPPVMVLNADDDYGQRWLQQLKDEAFNVYGYSIHHNIQAAEYTKKGIHAQLVTQWGSGEINTPLVGEFNLSNVLATVTVLLAMGEKFKAVLKQLPYLAAVKGRVQLFTADNKPGIVVDYAHSPDALEKVLQTLRPYTQKKLWCIFGCGGDRDKSKRPIMGKVASQFADEIVLTDDNSRSEDPAAIIADIIAGIPEDKPYHVEHDRARAIEYVLQNAEKNDMILVAGKGHEDYQEIKGKRHYFSDIEEVERQLGI